MFIYLFVLFLAVYFTSNINKLNEKLGYFFAYFSIVIFSSLRFFVGNDYDGYFDNFYTIKQGYGSYMEFGFVFINKFFSFSEVGYLYVVLLSSIMTWFFVFKVIYREKLSYFGIFFIFTTGMLFMINDQIRQGIALAIFCYSIKFIEKRQFLNYLVTISLTAILFHLSAIFLITVYFLGRIKTKPIVFGVLILASSVLSFLGFFNQILEINSSKLPFYQNYYEIINSMTINEISTGLGLLYHGIITIPLLIYYKKINRPVLLNTTLFGVILLFVFKDFLLTKRLSYYLLFTEFISLSLLFKLEIQTHKNFFKQVKQGLIVVCLIFFSLQCLFSKEQFGAIPYRTFLFEDSLIYPKLEYFKLME